MFDALPRLTLDRFRFCTEKTLTRFRWILSLLLLDSVYCVAHISIRTNGWNISKLTI